jgi:colanic acid biosynthesis glycosyl transferase WcaI
MHLRGAGVECCLALRKMRGAPQSSQGMKFLILTQYFPPEVGAAQSRLSALSQELTNLGHFVEVVTALPNYPRGKIFPKYRGRWFLNEEIAGTPVRRSWVYASQGAGPSRMASFASFSVTSLFGLFKAARPDWIFVESPPLSLVVPALLAARLRRVPVIMNVADLWPDSIRALGLGTNRIVLKALEKLEQFAYKHSQIISTVSEAVRQTLIRDKGVPAAKIALFPNGADLNVFEPMPPDTELKRALNLKDEKVILYAGTHGFAQGLEHALEAARLLRNDGIRFLFLGDGSEKARLVHLSNQLKLNNVTFRDPVDPSEVPRYFSIADCGLSSQRDVALLEGNHPAKIVSIMACAKPVIFAGRGEGAQLVADARGGIVVAPEDPSALASAIRNICANPAQASEMGRNGRAFVEQNFAWSDLVGNWLGQICSLAPPAQHPQPNRRTIQSPASQLMATMTTGKCSGGLQPGIFLLNVPQPSNQTRPQPISRLMISASETAQAVAIEWSDASTHLAELDRIRNAYARRENRQTARRYSHSDPSHALRTDELKDRVIQVFRHKIPTPLADCRILDVGCGQGNWLRSLHEMGATPANLTGVDLLPERVNEARKLCSPLTSLQICDASSLPFTDGSFDAALAFTVFSSILDSALKSAVAAEILRVLRPGGLILWHDFHTNNPRNADVRRITRKEIATLFPGCRIKLDPITLAPPLSRLIAASPTLHGQLSRLPFLCTHDFGLIEKP